MSVTFVSNLGRAQSLATTLKYEQSTLTDLSTQLSTTKRHTDLTDYTASEARSLINLQSSAAQKQSYLNVISSVNVTLSIYDTTLTDLEDVVMQAQSLANNNPTYDANTAMNIAIQAGNYLKSVSVDLNQDLNGRYIYSGSRFTTPPVVDLTTTTADLTSDIITDESALPAYDSQYPGDESTLKAAYNADSAMVNSSYTLDYGITSNDPAFQKTIAGLRYLQAAGNATDAATYSDYLSKAQDLLSDALPAIQSLHTTVANYQNAMTREKNAINTALDNLTTQVNNIQAVDTTEVSTEITAMETVLQASYSVTGTILKLSIVNFL
ncbi:MAG: flagellin [Alphaproteobacteria bacterium]|nr:flagellin [Alphaproteobacteria bacterium]